MLRSFLDALTYRRRPAIPGRPAVAPTTLHVQALRDWGRSAEAAAVLLASAGPELEALKDGVEASGDARSLLALVHDEVDRATRQRLLRHLGAKHAARGRPIALITLEGGVVSSARDPRYPIGTPYPGAVAFLRALTAGPIGVVAPAPLLDRERLSALGLGDAFGLPVRSPGLGALSSRLAHEGLDGLLAAPLAVLTSRAVAAHRRLFPGRRYLAVAGLESAARRLLASGVVDDVFLHRAHPELARGATGPRQFRTYVGAAAEAAACGLLSPKVAWDVAAAARSELAALELPSAKLRVARERELEGDVERLASVAPLDQAA